MPFWDLETIRIATHQEELRGNKDSDIIQVFHDSFRIEESRRMVSLPKKENVTLLSNRQNAEKRFKSLEARLMNNAKLCHLYYTHMWTTYNVDKWRSSTRTKNMRAHSTYLIMRCPKVNEETLIGESYSTHRHMRTTRPP